MHAGRKLDLPSEDMLMVITPLERSAGGAPLLCGAVRSLMAHTYTLPDLGTQSDVHFFHNWQRRACTRGRACAALVQEVIICSFTPVGKRLPLQPLQCVRLQSMRSASGLSGTHAGGHGCDAASKTQSSSSERRGTPKLSEHRALVCSAHAPLASHAAHIIAGFTAVGESAMELCSSLLIACIAWCFEGNCSRYAQHHA